MAENNIQMWCAVVAVIVQYIEVTVEWLKITPSIDELGIKPISAE